jgi:methanethiol S-methyltransferase
MTDRILIFLYAVLSYVAFLVASAYAVGFVGNLGVPKSIDVGGVATRSEALLVDLVLLASFALQHSIMARPAFKRWSTRFIPASAERSTYVLLSSLLLVLLFWQWRPLPTVVWRTDGLGAAVIAGLYWTGWLVVLASTFMIDHFDLTGLRQGYAALRAVDARTPTFRKRWLYRVVRHPIMLGFVVAFWATPVMSLGHLLFAVMTSGYIFVGLWLEERDLQAAFGETYQRYRDEVPMLVPFASVRGRAGRSRAPEDAARSGFCRRFGER